MIVGGGVEADKSIHVSLFRPDRSNHSGERGERGDRSFDKEKRMGPDGSFQPTYVSGTLSRLLVCLCHMVGLIH